MGLKEGAVRGGVRNVSTGVSAIPDSVVDNFEDSDADPAGVYGPGQTIADYYQGDTGSFARTTTDAIENTLSVESTATGAKYVASVPGDGLNQYPFPEDTVRFLIRDSRTGPKLLINAEVNAGAVSGYAASIDEYDTMALARIDDGGFTSLADTTVTTGVSAWYWGEIDVPADSGTAEGDIEYRLYELNGDLTRGALKGTLTATDTTYVTNRGVGFGRSSGSNTGTIIDGIEIV